MQRISGPLVALITALLLAACGTAQTSTGGMGTTPGNDQGASVTAMPTATMMPDTTTEAGSLGGTDHGGMAISGAPYDAQFIDSMIMHHEGAIDMANQALEQAERQEVKDLATNIIKAQEAEIVQLREWRTQWYPELADSGGMGMDMGDMMISDDTSTPFDQRFIEAMIPHHQSAVEMAKDAQQKAEHGEIKTLAGNIITDQEKEIAQMQQWLKDWYGQ